MNKVLEDQGYCYLKCWSKKEEEIEKGAHVYAYLMRQNEVHKEGEPTKYLEVKEL